MQNLMTLGDFLKKIRETKKIKQSDVSRSMGVNPSVACRYEGNLTRPSLERIPNLIAAYKLTKQEEFQFIEILNLRELRSEKAPRELQILSQLLMLPQSVRQRVIQAAIAYDSSSKSK